MRDYLLLGSGSSGNAAVLRAGPTLLLDCGFSASELIRRMEKAGRDAGELDGILLTHEHADHARGAAALAQRLGIPVLGTPGTLRALPMGTYAKHPIEAGRRSEWNGLNLLLFPVSHDASEPAGIRVESNGSSLGLLTDAGEVDAAVVEGLRDCTTLIVESNHDPELLTRGPYPESLKRRIASRHGHLSNDECGRLLTRVVTERTERVVLTHLSRTNNTPELALATNHALFRRTGRAAPPMSAAPRDEPFGPLPF